MEAHPSAGTIMTMTASNSIRLSIMTDTMMLPQCAVEVTAQDPLVMITNKLLMKVVHLEAAMTCQ